MERYCGNTGRLRRNLHVILKFTERTKYRRSFLKNMACSDGDKLFGDNFHAVLDKGNWEWNWKWCPPVSPTLTKNTFYRTIVASNESSSPKYGHLQG